ncbi:hypothetical protein TNCV_1893411 [Trichonephila clavipes]|nr:hypothetical protein TNCV_1893411 [Trichonephila clavipes]
MKNEVRNRGGDVFTVNKSNIQPTLYPPVTVFLLCQVASFAVLRFIWRFVKKDYVCNMLNFIESAVSKKLHVEIDNTFVIRMLIKKFGKPRKCFALLKLAEIISVLNVLVQFCLTNYYFERQIFSQIPSSSPYPSIPTGQQSVIIPLSFAILANAYIGIATLLPTCNIITPPVLLPHIACTSF